MKKTISKAMTFAIIAMFLFTFLGGTVNGTVADIIGRPQIKRVTSLTELNPRERHELKPA